MNRARTAMCVKCLAITAGIVSALVTGNAIAADAANGPAAMISAQAWLGLFSTVLFSLIGGYIRGVERRVGLLEHEDRERRAEISLMKQTVLREHPSRSETNEHRAYVESELRELRNRMDLVLAAVHNRRAGDH